MIGKIRGLVPEIHESVFVAESSDVIGDVKIAAGASVWFHTVIRGDVNSITIGEDSNVQDGTVVHGTYQKWPVKIGKAVSIGHSVTIHGCTIEDHCLIGMGATIIDGAVVGKESIVGAHSLVTQGMKIPPRSLVLGSPAKVVRTLSDEEVAGLHAHATRYKMYVEWYKAEPAFQNCFKVKAK